MADTAARRVETSREAIDLALDWAEGRCSYMNTIHADTQERRLEVVAVMDAQEVVKWTAIAAMFFKMELDWEVAQHGRTD